MDRLERVKVIIQQYANKGEILLEESYAKGEHASTTGYWDGYGDCAKHLLKEIDSMQEEPKEFKIGDKVKYLNEEYIIEDITDHYILHSIRERTSVPVVHVDFGNEDYKMMLVEEPKEFKPVRKKQPEGVLKELLDNMDEKELEETRNAKIGVCKDNYVEFEDGTCIDFDPSMQLKPAFNVKDGDKVEVLLLKV